MTDEGFLQLDLEELLKEFQALQKKRTRKSREVMVNRFPFLLSSDVNAWNQNNRNIWYLNGSVNSDSEDDGGYGQPPPDFYSFVTSELIHEKTVELLSLIGGFYLQTMIESSKEFVDRFLAQLMMNIFWEVTKR